MMSLAEDLTPRYFQNRTLSDLDAHAKIKHAVYQIDYAQKCFAAGDFTSCKGACEEIVSLPEEGRSKAIRAKAYMLLARAEVEGVWWQRSSNAQHALECWDLVIERDSSAHSRFPIDQALKYRIEAEKMYKEAQRAGVDIAAACAERSRFFQATSSQGLKNKTSATLL
ncbi:hypothetical protein AC579_9862 [Pseudocercospora musae]|uniref:Inclusion body clearance protein iml2 n=1 Tax=Pseudocercospora musae TaxID=113226 RepID=A0A139I863_9PEZI|nr:hypothetical protein AC579_9862 [Pseudocercospora musae]